MTQPALKVTSKAERQIEAVALEIPRMNERVLIGRYPSNLLGSDFQEHCATIRKCGLVAEVVKEDGMALLLYAARRRDRNKHD